MNPEEEEVYYPCSENKGADQLRGYREADLRLCFRICRLLVFPWGGSDIVGYGKQGRHANCYLLNAICILVHVHCYM